MKKFSLITTVIVPLTLFSGCIKKEIVNEETGAMEIQFKASDETTSRAAIGSEGFPAGSTFSVWGFMTKDTETATVFEGDNVTKEENGNWVCDATRYWFPEWNYNFYAVYPNDITTFDGTKFTISNFQCPTTVETADDITDIMSASQQADGSTPTSVNLLFKHALSKINIAVKLADDIPNGYKVDIKKLQLIAYTKGTMTLPLTDTHTDFTPSWDVDENSLAIFNFAGFLQSHIGITSNGSSNSPIDITTKDIFLIPQTMQADVQSIAVEYRLMNDKDSNSSDYKYIDNSISINLANAALKEWQPGDALTYTITISKYNVTVVLNVGDWSDGNADEQNIDFE